MRAARATGSRPPSSRLLGAVLFAAGAAMYANTLPNGYAIDDEIVTRGHHLTSRGVRALPDIFTSTLLDFAGQQFDYRPLAQATFALEHEMAGESPHVGHAVNALLYGATAAALFSFLLVILGAGAAPFAALATALFVVHPIHTEVVASLKSRDEILALLFGLVSAASFTRMFEQRRPADAAVGLSTLALALMSKPSAVAFLALVPLSVAFKRPARWKEALALGAALAAGVVAFRHAVLGFVPTFTPVPTFAENPLVTETGWTVRLAASLESWRFYLQKLALPYPLSFYYGYDTISLPRELSLRAAGIAAGLGGLAAYAVRRGPAGDVGALGVAWLVIALAPYTNLFVLAKGIVAERSAYLASVGFAVAAAAALYGIAGRDVRSGNPRGSLARNRIAAACALLVVGAHAAITWDRNRDWKDAFTLYEADIGRLQRSVMAHQIYSRQLRREHAGDAPSPERERLLRHAIVLSERALEILPAYAAAHEHIGAIRFYDLGDAAGALPHFLRAAELEPRYVLALHDGVRCAVALGRFDLATELAERLVEQEPGHATGLFYLAKLYFQAGRIEEAFATNAKLARAAPDRDLPYLNYGYFYAAQSDTERAVENFEKALAIAPHNPKVVEDLIGILTDRGDVAKAERYAALARTLEERPPGADAGAQ